MSICGFAVILSLQLTGVMIVEINGLSRENGYNFGFGIFVYVGTYHHWLGFGGNG